MCEKMTLTDADKVKMAGTPEATDKAKEEIMNDPEMMKMVAARAMIMMSHSEMKMDGSMPMKK
jgi:hypothetical protein